MNMSDVSGVGLHEGKLILYLATDSVSVRQKSKEIILKTAPGIAFDYVVTGKFKKY